MSSGTVKVTEKLNRGSESMFTRKCDSLFRKLTQSSGAVFLIANVGDGLIIRARRGRRVSLPCAIFVHTYVLLKFNITFIFFVQKRPTRLINIQPAHGG